LLTQGSNAKRWYHAKFASGAASVNLTREKSNLQFQSQSRQTPSLQIPCAVIGAGSIILAGLVAAEGIAAAVLYLLIGGSFGFYQATDISRSDGTAHASFGSG
jgi:hypothetical protein